MNTSLFTAKAAEIKQHISYITQALESLRDTAYPQLAGRLNQRLGDLVVLSSYHADLEVFLSGYSGVATSGKDEWPQIFSILSELANTVQSLRVGELPAYLASSADDHYVANILQGLLNEVGIIDISPSVTLHQQDWFAVRPRPLQFPLFYLPASILISPAELPLVFHEFGHVLFNTWTPDFPAQIEQTLAAVLDRKKLAIQAMSDPDERDRYEQLLSAWQPKAFAEIEEIVCDVVGMLLGGYSFAVAFGVGLLTPNENPFRSISDAYPPMDFRMRIGSFILQRLGVDTQSLQPLEEGWSKVRELFLADQPFWYDWLYDDFYLEDIVLSVETYLHHRSLVLAGPNPLELRSELQAGAVFQLTDTSRHLEWIRHATELLRATYSPSI